MRTRKSEVEIREAIQEILHSGLMKGSIPPSFHVKEVSLILSGRWPVPMLRVLGTLAGGGTRRLVLSYNIAWGWEIETGEIVYWKRELREAAPHSFVGGAMSTQDALKHLTVEFVERFGLDAEGCTNAEATEEALKTLDALV